MIKSISKSKIDIIKEKVDKGYCPYALFYPVLCAEATTIDSEEKRVETCTQCWKKFFNITWVRNPFALDGGC